MFRLSDSVSRVSQMRARHAIEAERVDVEDDGHAPRPRGQPRHLPRGGLSERRTIELQRKSAIYIERGREGERGRERETRREKERERPARENEGTRTRPSYTA